MKDSKKISDEVFKGLSKKDFDGHTEFKSLSPKKRLQWLSEMAKFIWKARNRKE